MKLEVREMKPVIPKQHGAWGMLIIPYFLGAIEGEPTWFHIPLLLLMPIFELPLLILAFLPSTIRAIGLYGKQISIKRVGILEIVNAAYFFFAILIIL
jgi:hypothetical protein